MYIAIYTLLFAFLTVITGYSPMYLPNSNSYFEIIGPSLIHYIPALLAWLVGIFLGVIMLGRGGARAEKLFLAGCSLMFVNIFLSPFLIASTQWLSSEYGYTDIKIPVLMQALPYAVFSLSGIICLVGAFWLLFWKEARQE
jgi:hypothetical protein